MSKQGNPSPRTFGEKLLEPKGNTQKFDAPVITRMCDPELLRTTGEVRYLEGEEKVSRQSAIENAKKMREELTHLIEFDAIGSYGAVAKHYKVHTSTAHAHLMHLRAEENKAAKKAKLEEKTMIEGLSMEEIEQFHTDTEVQELPKVEFDKPVDLITDEQNDVQDELKCNPEDDCVKEVETESNTTPDKELNQTMNDLERSWDKPKLDRDIEALKKTIKSGMSALHQMSAYRAELEFQSWITEAIEGC